jgi:hypothetical protein
MKNPILRHSVLFFFYLLISSFLLQAQAPQGIPYQAIARNVSGVAIANTAVKVRFSIRDSIATGPVRYQETHNPTTSALGLFSVNVGMGTVVSGTFSGINWGKNAKFLQVELNTTGGTSYTDLGTTQMMSVPYALYAGQAATSLSGNSIGNGFTMISNASNSNITRFTNALNYCYNLEESGYSDWRLPTLSEVLSYFSLNGVFEPAPNNLTSKYYGWTLSEDTNSSWFFITTDGAPTSYSAAGSLSTKVKCVR